MVVQTLSLSVSFSELPSALCIFKCFTYILFYFLVYNITATHTFFSISLSLSHTIALSYNKECKAKDVVLATSENVWITLYLEIITFLPRDGQHACSSAFWSCHCRTETRISSTSSKRKLFDRTTSLVYCIREKNFQGH